MTIRTAIKESGLTPTEAEILLAEILRCDRAALFAYPEMQLAPRQEGRFQEVVARRKKNEPLAYILGHKEFFGLDFTVDKRVLIPRPETEDLVEAILKEVRQIKKPVIVDVGTGSGCIIVSLAKNLPEAHLIAIDVSFKAMEIAKRNAQKHGVENKITFLRGNLLKCLPIKTSVDVVAANLPYVKLNSYHKLDPQIFYEPKLALIGGKTGMEMYERLFEQAKKFLKTSGKIIYEVDGRIIIK